MIPWRFTLLGYQLGLAQPWFLASMIVAAALGALAFGLALNRRARVAKAIPSRLAALTPRASLGGRSMSTVPRPDGRCHQILSRLPWRAAAEGRS